MLTFYQPLMTQVSFGTLVQCYLRLDYLLSLIHENQNLDFLDLSRTAPVVFFPAD